MERQVKTKRHPTLAVRPQVYLREECKNSSQ
nr:MAG TPA: hypothetical protein [Microviridae sp.]